MAVYVDPLVKGNVTGKREKLWCHMIADTKEELIQMARICGVHPKHIQKEGTPHEHFDLSRSKRAVAVRRGAVEISTRELVAKIEEKRRVSST